MVWSPGKQLGDAWRQDALGLEHEKTSQLDGWMDGWMDGWVYVCMHVYACMDVDSYPLTDLE